MHAHDRTLLASLAFADPDKKDRLHDAACRYLTEEPQASEIVRLVETKPDCPVDSVTIYNRSIEQPISKGQGQYRTTIGFLDGVIEYRIGELGNDTNRVLLEVKISRVDAAAILRQLRLYQQYEGASFYGQSWVVAVAFDMNESATNMLIEHEIHVVRLGTKFREWMKASQLKSAKLQEI